MTISAPQIPEKADCSQHRKPDFRLAIVLSHPVQYYAPWFRSLTERGTVNLRVFYLWNPDSSGNLDRKFGRKILWDLPLLEGYASDFVPNSSKDPGTHHFSGLDNPEITERVLHWQPDAILLFGYAWNTHLRVALSPSLRKIPLLFRGDSHELPSLKGLQFRPGRAMRQFLFRRFSGFLSVGTAHDQYLKEVGVPGEKIHRCPHAVDNHRFQSSTAEAETEASKWKAELGISPERPVALFAGKFEEKKRPHDLLKAFLSLDLSSLAERPALLFVGSGILENELRELSGDAFGRDVFFAPFQNQSLMPRTYATGDFLVLPSLGRGETWGLAVNECMNLGRPALVSDHVGCGPDLVEEGRTGWIFPAGNVAKLSVKLALAFADRDQTRKFGRNAKTRIDDFSYDSASRGLERSLRQIKPNRNDG